jgi:hypothetical protein
MDGMPPTAACPQAASFCRSVLRHARRFLAAGRSDGSGAEAPRFAADRFEGIRSDQPGGSRSNIIVARRESSIPRGCEGIGPELDPWRVQRRTRKPREPARMRRAKRSGRRKIRIDRGGNRSIPCPGPQRRYEPCKHGLGERPVEDQARSNPAPSAAPPMPNIAMPILVVPMGALVKLGGAFPGGHKSHVVYCCITK